MMPRSHFMHWHCTVLIMFTGALHKSTIIIPFCRRRPANSVRGSLKLKLLETMESICICLLTYLVNPPVINIRCAVVVCDLGTVDAKGYSCICMVLSQLVAFATKTSFTMLRLVKAYPIVPFVGVMLFLSPATRRTVHFRTKYHSHWSCDWCLWKIW
jgi:hypothetical protein